MAEPARDAGAAGGPIPLTVVGGFLGSGKTTLVNGVLGGAPGRRIAVLVNDFGAVNVDAGLIEASDGETLELANGCICCGLANGYADALGRVLSRPLPPEHILVEASGVADVRRVAQIGLTPGFTLDGIVVLADAETVRSRAGERYVGDVVCGQLAVADLVVLNRVDLVAPPELGRTRAWLLELVPDARLLETTFAAVPLDVLLGAGDGSRSTAHDPRRTAAPPAGAGVGSDAHGGGAHDPAFATTTVRVPEPLEREALLRLLERLPRDVYRLKGFVELCDAPGRRTLVQAAGRRHSLADAGPRRGAPDGTLVAVGSPGALRAAALEEGLRACAGESRISPAGAAPAPGANAPGHGGAHAEVLP